MLNLKIKSQLVEIFGCFEGVQNDAWPRNLRRLDWGSAHADSFPDSSSPVASVSPFFRQGLSDSVFSQASLTLNVYGALSAGLSPFSLLPGRK